MKIHICKLASLYTVLWLILNPIVHAENLPASETSAATNAQRHVTLQQVLRAAQNNIDVALSRSTLIGTQADIAAADHAPLPTLSAKLGAIDTQNGIGGGNFLRDKRIDKGIGIDWTWERNNKRTSRVEAAQRLAAAAQADLEDIQIQQMLLTASAYFDLTTAQDKLVQVRAMAADTARIASTAARRLQAGDLSRQDTLRLEIEAQRARGDELTTLIELKRANIALAQLIGHTSADFLHAEFAVPKISVFANNTALLMQIDQRADVRAAQQRVAAARAALDNASAQKYSDITWGASADHYPGTSKRLFELRMQMPLQVGYQYQGEIVRAQAQLTTASDSLEKIRRTATMDILKLDADAQSANLRQQTYAQEIVPRAQMVAQQAELAYSKGASSLSDLLDTRRTLRATQIEALTARSDYAKAIVAWQLRMQPHSVLEQL